MTRFNPERWTTARSLCHLALLSLLCSTAAQAQYKVVGPDGKVTFTDRPPPAVEGKVTPLAPRNTPASTSVALPLELRQASSRYPATLYVITGACEPCDGARQLLRQRGVPFAEKQIVTADDSDALERLTGSRDSPTLTLGSQTLRGLSAEVWNSYLDAAGYPRTSRLPPNYQFPAASPLTERREVARPAPAPRPVAQAELPNQSPAAASPSEPAPAPGGIKF
jgi:glutaredoxin